MTQHLLGVAEIATMLGLTRQRVNQLIQTPGFPEPEAVLTAGRIWAREAIERWAATHPLRATPTGDAFFADFSDAARAVILRAQEEARTIPHDYLGTEHLLLAVLSDIAPGVRQRLGSLGIDRLGFAEDLTATCPPSETTPTGHIPFTPRAKAVLTAAAEQATPPVEPHHIARAIVGLADGLAARLLRERLDLDQQALVAEVDRVLAEGDPGPAMTTDAQLVSSLRCSFCTKPATEVRKLIAGPDVYICDACVGLCNQILEAGRVNDAAPPEPDPARAALAERVERLAAELDQLRRDLGSAR